MVPWDRWHSKYFLKSVTLEGKFELCVLCGKGECGELSFRGQRPYCLLEDICQKHQHMKGNAEVCWWSQVTETCSRVTCDRESCHNVPVRISLFGLLLKMLEWQVGYQKASAALFCVQPVGCADTGTWASLWPLSTLSSTSFRDLGHLICLQNSTLRTGGNGS